MVSTKKSSAPAPSVTSTAPKLASNDIDPFGFGTTSTPQQQPTAQQTAAIKAQELDPFGFSQTSHVPQTQVEKVELVRVIDLCIIKNFCEVLVAMVTSENSYSLNTFHLCVKHRTQTNAKQLVER
jgi:hypothetical protein